MYKQNGKAQRCEGGNGPESCMLYKYMQIVRCLLQYLNSTSKVLLLGANYCQIKALYQYLTPNGTYLKEPFTFHFKEDFTIYNFLSQNVQKKVYKHGPHLLLFLFSASVPTSYPDTYRSRFLRQCASNSIDPLASTIIHRLSFSDSCIHSKEWRAIKRIGARTISSSRLRRKKNASVPRQSGE